MVLAGCNSPEQEAKDHLQRGIELYKKGEFDKAKLELKTSSQADQNTADTYYYLALMDEKNKQFKAMRDNLLKAVELAPDNIDAKLKLGKVQLLLGEPEAGLNQAESVLAIDSRNLEAMILKASVQVNQNKLNEAFALVDEIIKINPQYIDALLLKATLYARDNKLNEALHLIDTGLNIDAKNTALYLFKAQLNAKLNNAENVIADYLKLIDLTPDNDQYKLTLVKIYLQAHQQDKAESILEQMVEAKHGKPEPKLLLLDFLQATNPIKVTARYQDFIDYHKNEPKMLLYLSDWMVSRGRFEEVKETLARVIDLEKNSETGLIAKTLRAKVAFEEKNRVLAQQVIDEILTVNPNYNNAKVLQARLWLESKQYAEATDILNKVLWSNAENEEALVLLSQLYLITNNRKLAEENFKKTLELNPANLQALAFVYGDAMGLKNYKYAKTLLLRALSVNGPNTLFVLEKLAQLSILEKEWEFAQKTITAIAESASPYSANLAKFLEAQLYQQQGDFVKAIDLYKELLKQLPEHKQALRAMAQSYEALGKRNDMETYLNQLLVNDQQILSASLLLSELLVLDKQFDKASILLEALIKKQTAEPVVYIELAKLRLGQNNTKAAMQAYQDGLRRYPDNLALALAQASLFEIEGDFTVAKSIYQALLEKNQDLDIAANNLATLLIDHPTGSEDIDKAFALVEKFKESYQLNYRDTYAWALIKQGNLAEGLKILNQIIIAEPEEPIFRYHLGVAHFKNGNNGMAISEIKQAIDLAEKKGSQVDKVIAEKLLQEIIGKSRGG
jgi:tetratricopeptide (TPR) repeat protein